MRQVRTRGAVAAAFDHWDSRAGDPQLHTHVTVANRVQADTDGRWRTVDSRALYRAAVAFSERYDLLLADAVTRRTGLTWVITDRDGRHRRPSRELAVVPAELRATFSQRSAAIEPAVDQALGGLVHPPWRRATLAGGGEPDPAGGDAADPHTPSCTGPWRR